MSNVSSNTTFLTLLFGMGPFILEQTKNHVEDNVREPVSKDKYYNKYSNIRHNNTHNRKSHKINQPQWRGCSH